ncbi:hypothetical protein GGQ88_001383 [Novosphingobium hassiacum]|uniref:Uncharacterized protein n=1 Tax=Novosphingobium hassiacum TaxID=173676 RepID=A0A7W5ZXS4_9SPHN|nr:hypothetical protein [Novosphingobium hassiacum]MBB3860122.1 hypothetical protein [Novosphingobium hassiacum]
MRNMTPLRHESRAIGCPRSRKPIFADGVSDESDMTAQAGRRAAKDHDTAARKQRTSATESDRHRFVAKNSLFGVEYNFSIRAAGDRG